MRIATLLLSGVLLAQPRAIAQDEPQHTGSFEEALEHHSFADLRQWRDAHPWSLGDRLATFLEGLLETRRVGERIVMEDADLRAAFLAEALAEDPFSGWIMQVRGWDTEACSHHETVIESLSVLPEMITAGEKDAAWSQIADLRDHLAPKGSWELCAPALGRSAAAFLHAGDRERARQLATELASSGEELRQGSVLALAERLLGEIAREEHDIASAVLRNSRSFEIGGKLDSGPRASLLDEIEALERCGIDTLLEFAIGEKETLVLVVGKKGRSARRLPIGRDAIEVAVRHVLDPLRSTSDTSRPAVAPFETQAAHDLYDQLLRPVETYLGKSIGIVPDGILASLPMEVLVADLAGAPPRSGSSAQATAERPRYFGRDHAIVYLTRAPLGGTLGPSPTQAPEGSGSLVIDAFDREASDTPDVNFLLGQASGPLAPVRLVRRAMTVADLISAAAGAERLHFESPAYLDRSSPRIPLSSSHPGSGESLDLERVRGMKLRASLVVLAECQTPAKGDAGPGLTKLCEAFHEAGVRDVIGGLWCVGATERALFDGFYRHLAKEEDVDEAMRAARAERMEGDDSGPPRWPYPWYWGAWIVHRRY
jgi:CHAT domain-containing protein